MTFGAGSGDKEPGEIGLRHEAEKQGKQKHKSKNAIPLLFHGSSSRCIFPNPIIYNNNVLEHLNQE